MRLQNYFIKSLSQSGPLWSTGWTRTNTRIQTLGGHTCLALDENVAVSISLVKSSLRSLQKTRYMAISRQKQFNRWIYLSQTYCRENATRFRWIFKWSERYISIQVLGATVAAQSHNIFLDVHKLRICDHVYHNQRCLDGRVVVCALPFHLFEF